MLFCLSVVALALYIAYANYPWWHAGGYDPQFDKWFPLGWGIFLTVVAAGGAFGLGCGAAAIVGGNSKQIWNECWRAPMVAMRSSDGIHGTVAGGVFMISGQIDSAQVYYYYTLKRDGSFQPHKWRPDNDTSIFEEDRKDGEVVQCDSAFKKPWVDWFGFPNDRLRMDFHIPRGSLRQGFELK